MGPKRIRTPHYITGLGTGNVQPPTTTTTTKTTSSQDQAEDRYTRHTTNRLRNRPAPEFSSVPEHWGFQVEDGVAPNRHGIPVGVRHHRSTPQNHWEFSALAMLCTVIVLTALFVHLIAESSHKTVYSHAAQQRSQRNKNRTKVRKKKTDEWNEDDETGDVLSESIRSNMSGDVDDTSTDTSKPPSVYYPYKPTRGMQQHRHRKVSATTTNTAGSTTQTTSGSMAAVSIIATTAATATQSAVAATVGVSATATTLPHSNYYASSATASTTTAGYRSPEPDRRLRAHSSSSFAPRDTTEVLPGAYPTPTQPPRDTTSVLPSAHPTPTTTYEPSTSQQRPPSLHAQPFSSLHAQPFSTVSSFESSSTEKTPPTLHDDDKRRDSSLFSSSPKPSPRRSPTVCLSVPTGDGSSVQLMSPGSEQTPRAAGARRLSVADLVEKSTPRAGRNNFPIPEHSAVGDGPAVRVRLDAGRLNQPHVSPVAAVTGAATIAANAQVPADGNDIPFMPSLDFHHYHPVAPPKQVNVDELHLYQLMESGSVSHWEARVAEESRLLQKQAFPKSEQSVTDVIMSGQVSNESCVSLASDDPRNSIKHKRTDLTISTDSSASLQAAVEFSELELVEVIGGGGFGQVWKAIWRGTPVAVKVLTGSAQSKNVPRSILEEFAAEINLLRGMRHPNICLYMGACLDPPNRAIITELAANGSLWDALRLPLMPPFTACDGLSRDAWPDTLYQPDARHGAPPGGSSNRFVPPKGAWPWMLIKRVALGAARGMSYLHSGKPPILHRDLKSANILLDDSYTAKVCDFGLSRIKAQERSMTGNCGTVQWMAPEVLASQSYNEKADVFSYGIICWELLTQKCPYEEMSPIQCALAVLNRNHRPEIPKWCPPPLHALIRSCVKKNPDERPSFPQIILALDSMQ